MRRALMVGLVGIIVIGFVCTWLALRHQTETLSKEQPRTQASVPTVSQDTPKNLTEQAKKPAQETTPNKTDSTLQPGSISGQFLDKDTGKGVPGVLIIAYVWTSEEFLEYGTDSLVKAAEAMSNEEGRFEIQGLIPGAYLLVRPEVPGYGPQLPEDRLKMEIAAGQHLDGLTFQLERGVAVSGRLIDTQGHPIEGGEVHLSQRNGEPRVTATNTQGEFVFHGAEVGNLVSFEAAAPGFAAVRLTRDSEGHSPILGNNGMSGVEIVLSLGRTVEGVLVNEAGEPIPDVELHFTPAECLFPVQTKKDGSFTLFGILHGLSEGTVGGMIRGGVGEKRLRFLDGTEVVPFDTDLHKKDVRLIAKIVDESEESDYRKECRKFNANPGNELTTGQIIDVDGNPVDGVEVDIVQARSDVITIVAGEAPNRFTVSGPEGKFALDFRSFETADLAVNTEGFVKDTFKGIRARSKGNILKVRRSHVIRGIIRDATTSEPVKLFRICAARPGRPCPFGRFFYLEGWSSVYDPEGQFTSYSQEPDTCRLCVMAAGYANAQQDITLGQDETGNSVDFLLDAERTVGGVVHDVNGNPVSGAVVVLLAPGPPLHSLGNHAVAGGNGRFLIKGVGAQQCMVATRQRGFVPAISNVDLTKENSTDVVLVLRPAGVIEGTALQNGAPAPEEFVKARPLDTALLIQLGISKTEWTATTDANGHYRIEDIIPGTYEVSFDAFKTNRTMDFVKHEAVVQSGMVTQVDFP